MVPCSVYNISSFLCFPVCPCCLVLGRISSIFLQSQVPQHPLTLTSFKQNAANDGLFLWNCRWASGSNGIFLKQSQDPFYSWTWQDCEKLKAKCFWDSSPCGFFSLIVPLLSGSMQMTLVLTWLGGCPAPCLCMLALQTSPMEPRVDPSLPLRGNDSWRLPAWLNWTPLTLTWVCLRPCLRLCTCLCVLYMCISWIGVWVCCLCRKDSGFPTVMKFLEKFWN